MDEKIVKEEKELINLWEAVGNKSLERALELLNGEAALDDNQIRAVGNLVAVAVSIDALNLRWVEQNQYASEAFQRRALQPGVKGFNPHSYHKE